MAALSHAYDQGGKRHHAKKISNRCRPLVLTFRERHGWLSTAQARTDDDLYAQILQSSTHQRCLCLKPTVFVFALLECKDAQFT
eukprot:692117-Rhodomonas_salina.1